MMKWKIVTNYVKWVFLLNQKMVKKLVFENPHEDRYEEAITVAVSALKDYIWDNKFSVYGFGIRKKDGTFIDDLCLNSSAEGVEGIHWNC